MVQSLQIGLLWYIAMAVTLILVILIRRNKNKG